MIEQLDGTITAPEGTLPLDDSAVEARPATYGDNKIDDAINSAFDKVEGKSPPDQTQRWRSVISIIFINSAKFFIKKKM